MKNFFAVAFLVAAFLVCGCGGEKTAENPSAEPKIEQPAPEPEKVAAVAADGTIWAIDEENMKYLADALDRNDGEYLKQLSVEQKAFLVDRDTKVTRIGTATADGFVMIKFNEGRYTNKEGYTFAYNIFTEAEYPAFVEARAAKAQAKKDAERQAVDDLLQNVLAGTEGYYDLMLAGDVAELNRIIEFYKAEEPKIIAMKKDSRIDSALRNRAAEAHNIIIERYTAIYAYLKSFEAGQKKAQENPSSKRYGDYEVTQIANVTLATDSHKRAEKLRQEFRDKYGY